MKSIGAFLKYARKQRNLTQEQVANRLNIVAPVLSKWENDRAVPPLDLLCKLCNVLNVSIEEIIDCGLSDSERILPPENYDAAKLGATLKELRVKNGLSQAELGRKLYVTSQTVSKWEAGGVSSLEILGKLAELFGVTPTELINGLGTICPKPVTVTAEQQKKRNRFTKRITAVILSVIIFLGAVAGLIAGLVLTSRKPDGGQDVPNVTEPEPEPEPEPEISFVTPFKEFYSVASYGQDYSGMNVFNCMLFEVVAGTPAYAVADGTVIEADNIFLTVKIQHSDGFVSSYGGVNLNVQVGDEVKRGEQIGVASMKKCSVYLFLDGNRVNPFDYITDLPEPLQS